MKLYKYSEFGKLNQALGSFKRNGTPVIKVEIILIAESEVAYFVLTDPKHEPKPKKETKKPIKKKEEKKKKPKK